MSTSEKLDAAVDKLRANGHQVKDVDPASVIGSATRVDVDGALLSVHDIYALAERKLRVGQRPTHNGVKWSS